MTEKAERLLDAVAATPAKLSVELSLETVETSHTAKMIRVNPKLTRMAKVRLYEAGFDRNLSKNPIFVCVCIIKPEE